MSTCEICGHPLPPSRPHRGAAKRFHRDCSKSLAYLAAFERGLELIEFAPGEHGASLCAQLQARLAEDSGRVGERRASR